MSNPTPKARTDTSTSESKTLAVAAETVHDPFANYTILGEMSDLDLEGHDSIEAAAQAAAIKAADTMPESENDIFDSSFSVFVIEDVVTVGVADTFENATDRSAERGISSSQ